MSPIQEIPRKNFSGLCVIFVGSQDEIELNSTSFFGVHTTPKTYAVSIFLSEDIIVRKLMETAVSGSDF